MNTNRLLYIGVALLIFALHTLFTEILFKQDLKKVSGNLGQSSVSIELTEGRKGRNFRKESYKSAILKFSLSGSKQNFVLSERIDMVHGSYNQMEGINDLLQKTDTISVWIRKADKNSNTATVYKLVADGFKAYEIQDADSRSFILFSILLGMSCLFFICHFMIIEKAKTPNIKKA